MEILTEKKQKKERAIVNKPTRNEEDFGKGGKKIETKK